MAAVKIFICAIIALAATTDAVTSDATLAYDPPEGNKFTKAHGSGTTNPSKYLWDVFDKLYSASPRPIKMSYDATGSTTGKRNFVNNNLFNSEQKNDWSCAELPLTAAEHAEVLNSDGSAAASIHLPFVLGAISMFHSVPGVTGLKLSADNVAKIYQQEITTWNDPLIAEDNDGLTLPSNPIVVLHRTKGSSSTYLMSEWLSTASTVGVWTTVSTAVPPTSFGGSMVWPADSATMISVAGSGGMTTTLETTLFAIGYLDSGHGHAASVQEVAIKNAAGNFVTANYDATLYPSGLGDGSPNEAATGKNGIENAAVQYANLNTYPESHDTNWADVSLVNMPGTYTWPMVAFSYFIVREDLSSLGEKGLLVKNMIEYVMSTEGQNLVSTYKFNKVPSVVMAKNTQGLLRVTTSVPSSCSNAADTLQGEFPFDDNAEAQSMKVYASGTTNPKKLHWHLMHLFAERMKIHSNKRIRLTYDAIGSGPGRDEFANKGTYPYANSAGKGTAGEKIYRPRPALPVSASFTGTSDKGGYQKLWKSEMGCAELPLNNAQVGKLTSAGRTALHLPMVLGAISFFVNLPGMTSIKLSPDALAKIFTGAIDRWDDQAITSLNPGFNPPAGQKITTVHRIKGSSSTYLSTEYLSKTSSNGIWDITEADCQEPWYSSTCPANSEVKYAEIMGWPDAAQNSPQWPSCSANTNDVSGTCANTFMFGARGSGKVTTALTATEYSIGYLDSGHGNEVAALTEVSVRNLAGNYVTWKSSPTGVVDAAKNAVYPASHESWTDFSLVNQAGANTYPITTFSYMIVDEDLTAMGAKGGLMKSYLAFINSQEGQEIVAQYGFSKLPQAVIDINAAGIERIKLADGVTADDYDFSPPTYTSVAAAAAVEAALAAACPEPEDGIITAVIAAVLSGLICTAISYAVFFGAGKRAGKAEAKMQSNDRGEGQVKMSQVETAMANARRSVSPSSRTAYEGV